MRGEGEGGAGRLAERGSRASREEVGPGEKEKGEKGKGKRSDGPAGLKRGRG